MFRINRSIAVPSFRFLTAACGLLVLLGLPFAGQAQHDLVTEYTWDAVPVIPDTVASMSEATVILQQHTIVDRVADNENSTVEEFYLSHIQVFLRDQGAVERNNTLQFNINGLLAQPDIRARSMSPDGKVHELEGDDFKFSEDDEDQTKTLYFAFEGLEPGSIIEYILVRHQDANSQGDTEYLQRGLPMLQQHFQVASDMGWEMGFKSYNGAPEMELVENDDREYLLWELETGFMPALEEQASAAMDRHKPRVDFRLETANYSSIKSFTSFVNATKIYHGTIHPELDKKTGKAVSKFVKDMDLHLARDNRDKLRSIESSIKKQIALAENYAPVLSDVASILTNRVANDVGMARLFAAIFRETEIPYELVVGCDRMERVIDADFESFLPLREIMFYLPDIDGYMDPSAPAYRAPYADMSLMATDALHIRNFELGDGITGVGSVRYVPALPDTLNVHDHRFTVTFAEDGTTADIEFENILMGYPGTFQTYYDLLDYDTQEEVIHGMLEYLIGEEGNPDIDVRYAEDIHMGRQPMVMAGRVETDRFSGLAGERRLFNIGELIGPQVEMYDSVARTLPVEELFNRRYLREFDITLPEGWVLQNPEDLHFDVRLDLDGETPMAFVSEYTLDGRKLTVRVHEYYRTVRLPLEKYPEYRAVINAAADFNKVALVLAPE